MFFPFYFALHSSLNVRLWKIQLCYKWKVLPHGKLVCARSKITDRISSLQQSYFAVAKCHCDFPSVRLILMEFSTKMPTTTAAWSLYRWMELKQMQNIHGVYEYIRVRNGTWRWCWSKINVYEITTYFQIYRIILYCVVLCCAVLYVQYGVVWSIGKSVQRETGNLP